MRTRWNGDLIDARISVVEPACENTWQRFRKLGWLTIRIASTNNNHLAGWNRPAVMGGDKQTLSFRLGSGVNINLLDLCILEGRIEDNRQNTHGFGVSAEQRGACRKLDFPRSQQNTQLA